MKATNQFSVTCQYYWQVKEIEKCYPGETHLTAWPYIKGVFIMSISTYGEYSKVNV